MQFARWTRPETDPDTTGKSRRSPAFSQDQGLSIAPVLGLEYPVARVVLQDVANVDHRLLADRAARRDLNVAEPDIGVEAHAPALARAFRMLPGPAL